MDLQKLDYLISQEEGAKLDFKEKIDLSLESGKKELAKDIIAIANTQGGRGYIVIGVKDKTKEIIGVEDIGAINEERIQQILSLRCDPPLNIRVEYFLYNEKDLCVITIFRSYKKPHQMRQNGAFYVRRGSTTDFARRDEIADMLQNGGLINNEQIPLLNLTIDVFDDSYIKKYLEKLNLKGEEDNYGLLCNLGFMHYDKYEDRLCPTIGGILLFSSNPQKYIPSMGIRIMENLYGKKKVFDITGNIFDLIDKVSQYLENMDLNYPVEAIEEAVRNAVIHRDYFDTARSIVIKLGKDRVVISNPGSIFGNERIDNLYHQYNPMRRNGWLYEKVILLDEKERFLNTNKGISYIKNLFKNIGTIKFINSKKINIFKVIMPGIKINGGM